MSHTPSVVETVRPTSGIAFALVSGLLRSKCVNSMLVNEHGIARCVSVYQVKSPSAALSRVEPVRMTRARRPSLCAVLGSRIVLTLVPPASAAKSAKVVSIPERVKRRTSEGTNRPMNNELDHLSSLPSMDAEYRFGRSQVYLAPHELARLTILRSKLGDTRADRAAEQIPAVDRVDQATGDQARAGR